MHNTKFRTTMLSCPHNVGKQHNLWRDSPLSFQLSRNRLSSSLNIQSGRDDLRVCFEAVVSFLVTVNDTWRGEQYWTEMIILVIPRGCSPWCYFLFLTIVVSLLYFFFFSLNRVLFWISFKRILRIIEIIFIREKRWFFKFVFLVFYSYEWINFNSFFS